MSFTIDREQMWYSFLTFFTGISPSTLITEEIDVDFIDEEGTSKICYSLLFVKHF